MQNLATENYKGPLKLYNTEKWAMFDIDIKPICVYVCVLRFPILKETTNSSEM